VSDYRIDAAARDVVGLIDAYDRPRPPPWPATTGARRWGGGSLHHADRPSLEFVAVNVPHPTVFERALRTSWDQRLKSWYVLAFQLPKLPEAVASAGNWRLAVRGGFGSRAIRGRSAAKTSDATVARGTARARSRRW